MTIAQFDKLIDRYIAVRNAVNEFTEQALTGKFIPKDNPEIFNAGVRYTIELQVLRAKIISIGNQNLDLE